MGKFNRISLIDLKSLSQNLDLTNDSYLNSYKFFVDFFDKKEVIEESDLVIGSHFVYGWMPTIINLNYDVIMLPKILDSLNAAKNGTMLDLDQLSVISKAVNNSVVGSSKLLHFINPELYPIWDSRVCRELTGSSYNEKMKDWNLYLDYQKWAINLSKEDGFEEFYKSMDLDVSKIRLIEMILFYTDKAKPTSVTKIKHFIPD